GGGAPRNTGLGNGCWDLSLSWDPGAQKRAGAVIHATTAGEIRQELDTPRLAASRRGHHRLMPDIFSGGRIDSVFGNISGMIAYAFEATANENQIQVASQLLGVVRHALD